MYLEIEQGWSCLQFTRQRRLNYVDERIPSCSQYCVVGYYPDIPGRKIAAPLMQLRIPALSR